MLILGFPHALALGVLAGILEFIPAAGWMIAATTIITFGILSHCPWIWMAALLGIWRMLIDYWIAPRVMGSRIGNPPASCNLHADGRWRGWGIRRCLSCPANRYGVAGCVAQIRFSRPNERCHDWPTSKLRRQWPPGTCRESSWLGRSNNIRAHSGTVEAVMTEVPPTG
jgi:AI-2E family transporter